MAKWSLNNNKENGKSKCGGRQTDEHASVSLTQYNNAPMM